jgi:exodeoxyribonuclease V beta subunit
MKQTEPFAFRAAIDRVAPAELADDELPGGTATGLYLHDLLEHVALPGVAAADSAETWAAQPEVAALLAATARRHRQPSEAIAPAARMVFASLRQPIAALDGAALCELSHERRELEFVFPTPRSDAGFVKGYIDLAFEHRGRLYLLDWKSDALPDYDAPTLAAHVAEHYALQARVYCAAAARMLALDGPARTEARFGGMLFCFLRGPGFHAERPDFTALEAYARELEARA